MPMRPRAHQLEEESFSKLQLLIPKEWTLIKPDKDYGIDGRIEIFDKDNNSTGITFFFQLKATDSHNLYTIQNYQMKKDTIINYNKFQLPVMIFRYSSYTNTFFYRWSHSIDFYDSKPSSKSINVNFKKWDKNQTSQIIEKYLIFYIKLKKNPENVDIFFSLNFPDNEIHGIPQGEVYTQLRHFFDGISKNSDISINIQGKGNNNFCRIEVEKNTLSISIGEIYSFHIHHFNKFYTKKSFKKYFNNDIIIGILFCLLMTGYNGNLIDIILKDYLLKSNYLKKAINPLDEMTLFPLISKNRNNRLKEIYRIIDIAKKPDIGINLTTTFIFMKKELSSNELSTIKNIIKLTIKLLKKENRFKEISAIYYNFGNILRRRTIDDKRDAIKYYKKAAKNNSDYFKRPYFWQEQAGIYFLLKNFKISELYYKYALKLGSPKNILALRADALMFCGEYKGAYKLFCKYLKKFDYTKERAYCEFCLKSKFLKTIIENFKTEKQVRQPLEATNIFINKENLNDSVVSEQDIIQSLEHDMLSNIAWFNKGLLDVNNMNYDDAIISFLFAALINPRDLESWCDFILINLQHKFNDKLFDCGLKLAFRYNCNTLLEKFIKYLHNAPKKLFSNKTKIKMINTMVNYFNEFEKIEKKNKDSKVLRFFSSNGKYYEYEI
jgi:tetratricopeptide (TPR) repeat protein